jgi:acetoin utilization deacetylase AcuC-like enzyme
MARDVMRIDGIPSETKEKLQALSLTRFGKSNASLLVRHLINECLTKESDQKSEGIDITGELIRVEIRLPKEVVLELEKRAEKKLSARNYYICSLLYKHLGVDQLQGDEIEVLRKSNYELAKIGTNINQISKAFNFLVKSGGGGKLPEIGKKMESLRTEIKSHTNKVLRVLESKTVIWEARGKKQKQKKN